MEYSRNDNTYKNYDVLPDPKNNYRLQTPVAGWCFGAGHNHPKLGVPIPGWGDVRFLSLLYQNSYNYNKGKVVMYIVVKNNITSSPTTFTYALTINNPTLLINKILADENSLGELSIDDKIQKMLDKESLYYDGGFSLIEMKFLEKYADYGINIHKATDDTLLNWKKLKLEGGVVVGEPCP